MRKLIMGIVEFRERMRPQYARRVRALALGQAPDALLVTGSDGRATPQLLASTHPGEETIAARVHRSLTERGVDLVTAIVPRHPERGAEI